MRIFRLFAAFVLSLILLLSAAPSTVVRAANPTISSAQPVVSPLEPVTVTASVEGYTGPATLLLFDSRGKPAGSYEFRITNGSGALQVSPRGALGDQWAALFVSGNQVAAGTLFRLDAQTVIRSGVPAFDQLYDRVKAFMANDVLAYELNGKTVRGYRSPDSPLLWLRDHYYQNRAFRYFETDLTSLIDAFREAQYPDGSFPDFVARPQWGIPAYRTPVEADVEFLFVQLVAETWKTTGDLSVVQKNLAAMQRAIDYTMRDPLRWEPSLGLVKRPFTIDTWDFEYGPTTTDPNSGQPAPRHWIDDQTKWGIFHGDNTGLAEALRSLAVMEEQFGLWESAYYRRVAADEIMQRLTALSWNGRFFTHHVKLVPYDVPGVDEAEQLSLSNAIALNRDVLSLAQAQAIVAEYRRRLNDPKRVAFAEWYSIDPPFPPGAFGLAGRLGERPGEYVNGGVMPLVGGELARGAFRAGYEEYGFDILDRYWKLIDRSNATYLWYYPTGGIAEVKEYLPTDGWGSSAMFGALIEGAAGIVDEGITFSATSISPRWDASPRVPVRDAYVVARYAASQGYAAYRWNYTPSTNRRVPSVISLDATGSAEQFKLRIMLPPKSGPLKRVLLNGQPVAPVIETIGTSRYVRLDLSNSSIVQVRIEF